MPDVVVYTTFDDPAGPFLVAASARGIVAAAWEIDEDGFRSALEGRFGSGVRSVVDVPPGDPARRVLETARPVVAALIQGEPTATAGVPIDLRDRPAFDRRVLEVVRGIGWGRTASYGQIARLVGAPRAARAVGGALGRNPISMIIPCHRVIASDGTLGGYGGDGWIDRDRQLSRKEALLLREGVTVARREG